MGFDDKIGNKAQEMSGKAKEAVGDATDNRDLQAEGVKDQAAANTKQAGEKIGDAAKDVKDGLGDNDNR
ncbi:CsbD family protein [Zhihengliuella sp.]|uniref:CsbD family protein n=1 Tax=Zhihengliuella sp. TaxID=1954483 RepID=UPI002811A401|nr:CsbD family protein [Zhihengliuella sp.]